ncbi:MAG: protein kinase, partial [Prevotellaceae bacterium]|nr:protein kinase [Prevotellaceae bacterium]
EEFETNGTVYYAMDYISGGSLDDHIARKGRLNEKETVGFAREICSALQFMHENGMLHLDLKPLNIMLRDGHAVLIDFGLSKQYNEVGEPESSTKVGAGTPSYAPIEQASYRDGKGFPVTMDIYALGATMFKMLTGRRPPEASDIMNFGFPADELQGLGVSPWLIELTGKCMSYMFKERPQSAAEVLEVLERHAPTGEETILGDDEPIVAEVVEMVKTKPEEPVQPKPKPKRKSILIIAVACLVAIGIVAAFLLSRKPTSSDEALALADTVAVDTMDIPDQPVSEVVEPEEQPEEPEKTEKEEVVTPAATQDTQTAQQSKTINGHEYVDLGLSVKWATCNVGASSPSEYGNYYAWGETSTKSEYTKENSKTWEVSMGSIAGNSSYDAARANWGGTWRLPTAREIDELANNCQRTWTMMDGHAGFKVTGPSGNSIFLPAAGDRDETSNNGTGGYGNYWGATPVENDTQKAYSLLFFRGSFFLISGYFFKSNNSRCDGFSVRPVSENEV